MSNDSTNSFSFSNIAPDPGGLVNNAANYASQEFADLNGWGLLALAFVTMVVRKFAR